MSEIKIIVKLFSYTINSLFFFLILFLVFLKLSCVRNWKRDEANCWRPNSCNRLKHSLRLEYALYSHMVYLLAVKPVKLHILQRNSRKGFRRCRLSCLLHNIPYLSTPLHTNSWDDISRTLFMNFPVWVNLLSFMVF